MAANEKRPVGSRAIPETSSQQSYADSTASDGALYEAERGCPVFPIRGPIATPDGPICSCKAGPGCPVPGKHPHIIGWPEKATTDRAQIERWARQWPGCNWGGITGRRAGRVIIEVDPRAGGDDGLHELEQRIGRLPDTRTFRSGSGGTHYVFAYPADLAGCIPNSAGVLAIGVDVRGDGGMGVLPGSRHRSGNRYELVDDLPPAELPAAWLALLTAEPASGRDPDAEPYDGPRAVLPPIMDGCRFMQHARDDAATLSEPDWFAALSIAANCEDGIEQAHRLSEPYPLYSYGETQDKAERARSQSRPFTCNSIASHTNGRWCDGCRHRGRIKSPIVLGLPRPARLALGGKAGPARAMIEATPPEERPEPEDGAALLDDVAAYLRRFVAYPSDSACVAHTLWIAHTHLMGVWDSTPRIAFLSPEPGSGKTRALEVSELLVPRPVEAVNMSAAALFRKVADEDGLPTILFDECDTIFGSRKAAESNEDVRGLLNAGHRRGAKSYRCVPRGRDILVVEYEAYCAVALAGLGDLPDTILSRSVIIRMRRRAPHERVEPFRRRLEAKAGHALRERLAAWCVAVEPIIGHPWPELPRGIEDRNADVWEPLIAIADAAGGDWPQRARAAAIALVSEARENTPSLGIRLLADLRDIFGDADQLTTEAILSRLQSLPESPWSEIRNGKDPLNALGLAQRLRPYGVQSKQIRDGGKTQKGYDRASLSDAWLRHLSPSSEKDETSETGETHPENPSNDAAIDVSLFGNVSGRPETNAQPETNLASNGADVSVVSLFAEHGEREQHGTLSERLRSMPNGELTDEERAALGGSSWVRPSARPADVPRACVDCGEPVKMRGLDRCDACVQLDYERRYGAPAGSQTEHMFAPGEPGLDRHTA